MVVFMDVPLRTGPGGGARRSTLKTPGATDALARWLGCLAMEETSLQHVRLRLDLAYDGTDFSGWAHQPGLRTVEGTLSAALATVLRLPEPARLTVAGRT